MGKYKHWRLSQLMIRDMFLDERDHIVVRGLTNKGAMVDTISKGRWHICRAKVI